MKQSLDGSLPKMCPAFRPSTAELSLTQNPMGNSHTNLLVWNQLLNWNQTLIKQSLDGPLPKLCLVVPPSDQDDCTAELSLTQDPMGNSHKNHLVWNQLLNQNQTLMEQSLNGPLPKLCPAVALSHQDGRHSAVALLLKAALIQVSDYRLMGASGFNFTCMRGDTEKIKKTFPLNLYRQIQGLFWVVQYIEDVQHELWCY